MQGFPIGGFVGHGDGLCKIELYGVRAVHGFGVEGEAGGLFQLGLFQQHVERQLGLVAFHGKAVGMGVEYFGFFPFARQRIVRTGEGSPNLYSPSAGTGEYEPRLGLFPGKTFHKGYFGLAGKRAYGQFHDAVVGFHLADTVRLAEFGCREYFGQSVCLVAALAGQAVSQLLAESGYGLGFGLRFDFL